MELFYSPLACSLAARIVCHETGLAPAYRRTDLQTKRVQDEDDVTLFDTNPMGKVPTLVTDDGAILTENVWILLYLGELAPSTRLVPNDARYEVIRWLSFVATEIHKRTLATIFSLENPPEDAKTFARAGAPRALRVLDAHLHDRDYLVANVFTVADAYLVWSLFLLPRPPCNISLDPFPSVRAYAKTHATRPSVKSAITLESREHRTPQNP